MTINFPIHEPTGYQYYRINLALCRMFFPKYSLWQRGKPMREIERKIDEWTEGNTVSIDAIRKDLGL